MWSTSEEESERAAKGVMFMQAEEGVPIPGGGALLGEMSSH